jgi:hypothetical protein
MIGTVPNVAPTMTRITHGGTAPPLRNPKPGNMSVLVLFKWEGDPDELLAVYDRELEHPVPREQPQHISHTCARVDDGVVVVDV